MTESQVFCSNCGTANSGTGGFCQKCGAAIAPAQALTAAASVAAAPVVSYVPAPSVPNREYGGFWIRLLADIIDRVVVGVVAAPVFFALIFPSVLRIIKVANQNREPTPQMVVAIFSTVFVFVLVVVTGQWLYESLLTSSSWQGTIGKKALRLKVVDEAGNRISFARATGRFFAKGLSRLMMSIGYLMIAFTERKQGLHDMIAGTLVKRY
jgi:uncharacterized RDD family membrane protein YckC